MTNEDISRILQLWEDSSDFDEIQDDDGKWHDIHELAIEINEALEKEPILDKIKAEVVKQNIADFIAVQSVLEIIDKYKAESEGKE